MEPHDSVWVGILRRNGDLNAVDDDTVREHLKRNNFPVHVIEAYLEERKEDTHQIDRSDT